MSLGRRGDWRTDSTRLPCTGKSPARTRAATRRDPGRSNAFSFQTSLAPDYWTTRRAGSSSSIVLKGCQNRASALLTSERNRFAIPGRVQVWHRKPLLARGWPTFDAAGVRLIQETELELVSASALAGIKDVNHGLPWNG